MQDNFDEYLRQGEPNKAEKAKVWKTAIGLQQVDGLKPSEYLIETAKQNIENHILKNRAMHIQFVEPVNDPVKANILQQLQQNPKANYTTAKIVMLRMDVVGAVGIGAFGRNARPRNYY